MSSKSHRCHDCDAELVDAANAIWAWRRQRTGGAPGSPVTFPLCGGCLDVEAASGWTRWALAPSEAQRLDDARAARAEAANRQRSHAKLQEGHDVMPNDPESGVALYLRVTDDVAASMLETGEIGLDYVVTDCLTLLVDEPNDAEGVGQTRLLRLWWHGDVALLPTERAAMKQGVLYMTKFMGRQTTPQTPLEAHLRSPTLHGLVLAVPPMAECDDAHLRARYVPIFPHSPSPVLRYRTVSVVGGGRSARRSFL